MRSKLEVKMRLANLKRVGLWTLTLSIRLPAILVLRDWELLYIELGGNEMHRDDVDAFECERGLERGRRNCMLEHGSITTHVQPKVTKRY